MRGQLKKMASIKPEYTCLKC